MVFFRLRFQIFHRAFLLEQFAQFVHFQGGDLYFPPSWSRKEAEYIAGERTLIVPLLWQGRGIGAVRLLGVGAKEARQVMPRMRSIAALILEVVARTRACSVDSSTGLADGNYTPDSFSFSTKPSFFFATSSACGIASVADLLTIA